MNRTKYYLLRLLLEKKSIDTRNKEYLNDLYKKQNSSDSLLSELYKFYTTGANKKEVLQFCIDKGILTRVPTPLSSSLKDLIKNRVNAITRRLNLKRNLIITLVGLDGSGKSTLIKKINESLTNDFKFQPKIIYLGHKEFEMSIPKKIKSQNKGGPFWTLIYFVLWPLEVRKRFLTGIKKSNVIICDRHPIFEPLIKKEKSTLFHFLYSLYVKVFVPKPHLLIYATGDVKTLYDRKKEMPYDVYVLKNTELNTIYEQYSGNKEKLQTDVSLEETIQMLTNILVSNSKLLTQFHEN